ncbi:MAG: helix-turn-helix domain-containing protein [Mycobacteriales bacterium]
MGTPVKRTYDNSRRARAARQTRRAVIEAARELFLSKGYGGTALTEVSAKAGVSVQTVYAQFGSKRALLKDVLDVAIVGDDEPVPLAGRPEVAAMRAEPDPERRCRMHAALVTTVAGRVEPVARVMRSAAAVDPEVDEQLQRAHAGRLDGMREMAEMFHARGELAPGLTVEGAAQRVAVLIDPELYRRTVVEHGWTPAEYEHWLGDLIIASLLPRRGAGRSAARR